MLSFLHPWMLTGLAALAIPILVHLFVRRRYRVVEWGAMQFLQPGQKARRRLQLQDLLLLVVRLGLVLLPVLALARPWIPAGILSEDRSAGSRAVAVIIDSSSSMSRPDGISTVHQTACRRAAEFLRSLAPGDSVLLIEARDVPVVASPLQPGGPARLQPVIERLRHPAGYSHLYRACERAVTMLVRAPELRKDIVVFTDRQRSSWNLDDPQAVQQWQALRSMTTDPPALWAVDCSAHLTDFRNAVSVGPVHVEPEAPVAGTPVHITARIRNHQNSPQSVPIHVESGGQQLLVHRTVVDLPAETERTVEFSHRFRPLGSQEWTVAADVPDDELQIDNRATAVVAVREPLQVLLPETSGELDRSRRHTFFAETALIPPPDTEPWIESHTVASGDITADDVRSADIILLTDPGPIGDRLISLLAEAVPEGTGLFLCLGPHTAPDTFRKTFVDSALLPGWELSDIGSADPDIVIPIRPLKSSLQADWLKPFAARSRSSFLNTVFQRWWHVETHGSSAVLMRLTNHVPVLFEHTVQRGRVLVLTVPLDDRWSSLPGRPDFVTFLYEALFHLAPAPPSRNLLAGVPFSAPLTPELHSKELVVERPDGQTEPLPTRISRPASGDPAEDRSDTARREMRYEHTWQPGWHRIRDRTADRPVDGFAIDYDRREDRTEQISDADRQRLRTAAGITMVSSVTALTRRMYHGESVTELWFVLLFAFLALLTAEAWLTGRLVEQRLGTESRLSGEEPDTEFRHSL